MMSRKATSSPIAVRLLALVSGLLWGGCIEIPEVDLDNPHDPANTEAGSGVAPGTDGLGPRPDLPVAPPPPDASVRLDAAPRPVDAAPMERPDGCPPTTFQNVHDCRSRLDGYCAYEFFNPQEVLVSCSDFCPQVLLQPGAIPMQCMRAWTVNNDFWCDPPDLDGAEVVPCGQAMQNAVCGCR